MDTIDLDNKFLDFKLFVLPETESSAETDKTYAIAILVNAEEYDESNQEFLKKIISAMKLDFEKEVYLSALKQGECINFHAIPSKTLISFDISIKQAGIHYPLKKYQLLQYNKEQFLLADSLTKIAADRNLKGMLWNVLKNLVG